MRRTRELTPLGVQIKKELIEQNITIRELARRIGKSDATICEVIVGKNKSKRTRELIFRELGLKVG